MVYAVRKAKHDYWLSSTMKRDDLTPDEIHR